MNPILNLPFKPFDNPTDPNEADDVAVAALVSDLPSKAHPASPTNMRVSQTAEVQFPGLTVWDTYHLAAVRAVYAQAAGTANVAPMTSDEFDALLNARIDRLLKSMLARRTTELGIQ